jgi:hypothetical protein
VRNQRYSFDEGVLRKDEDGMTRPLSETDTEIRVFAGEVCEMSGNLNLGSQ